VLRYVGDFCFVNDLRLRIDLTTYGTYGAVGRALARHGVGQLSAEPTPARTEWTALLSLLLSDPAPGDPFERFAQRVETAPIARLEVAEVSQPRPEAAAGVARGGPAHLRAVRRRGARDHARRADGARRQRAAGQAAVQKIVDRCSTTRAPSSG
jgi:hypothetical protein